MAFYVDDMEARFGRMKMCHMIADTTEELLEMASLWRYAPAGHPVFDRQLPLFEYLQERFKGFTPVISKGIEW